MCGVKCSRERELERQLFSFENEHNLAAMLSGLNQCQSHLAKELKRREEKRREEGKRPEAAGKRVSLNAQHKGGKGNGRKMKRDFLIYCIKLSSREKVRGGGRREVVAGDCSRHK